MEELYTVNELSERLKYSRSSIYRWISERSIPFKRLGREIRFTENDIYMIINQKINSGQREQYNGYLQWESKLRFILS